MKRILLILLMFSGIVFGQYATNPSWKLSGTTLSPMSSTYNLGFNYALRTGNKVLWKVTSDSTDYAPYEIMVHSTDFEGVPDYTFSLGYNESQSKVGEPIFGWRIENNYKVGATRFLESYFQYVFNGYTIRPIFMQFDKADATGGSTNLGFTTGTGVSFTESVSDSIYATLNRGGLTLKGYSGGQTSITLEGKGGYGAYI